MPYKRFGALSSSVNPEELSTTVTSVMKVLAGIAVAGGVLTVADSTTLLQAVPQIITQAAALVPVVYSIWNTAEVVFGIVRKIVVRVFEKQPS